MKYFIPDIYVQSIYKINYDKLKTKNIKCLIFDLDNTMSSYSEKEPNKKLIELINYLKNDFKVIIMSNNTKNRVRPFKEKLNVDSAHSSKKPLKGKYKKILAMYKFKNNEIACIGDQIITDIYGANKMGMISILVNQISKQEPLKTKFNRYFEKKILKKFSKKGILEIGKYYE